MNEVVVMYNEKGEAYLALRKVLPPNLDYSEDFKESDPPQNVIVIDMFEEDKVCYEC